MSYFHRRLRFNVFVALVASGTAVLATVLFDRAIGMVLNRTGYFKAMRPNATVHFDTNEFDVTASISNQGLRNKDVVIPKPHDVFRILVLGDSFTFGWGVGDQESWPRLLEATLLKKGQRIEVINAGVPGIDLTIDRWICRAYANQFDVDEILIGLSLDDLYQAASRELSEDIWSRLVRMLWPTFARVEHSIISPTVSEENPERHNAVQTSRSWQSIVRTSLKRNPTLLLQLDPSLRSLFLSGKISPFLVNRAARDPIFFMHVLDNSSLDLFLRAVKSRFELLRRRCVKNKPSLVVFIPSSSSISSDYQRFRTMMGYQMDDRLLTIELDRYLEPTVQGQGFHYVSLLESFRRDKCLGCYYPIDGHLTIEGNRRVAEYLLPVIMDRLP